jgi:hypothetical protein
VRGPGDKAEENGDRGEQARQPFATVGYNHANSTYIR